METVNAVDIVRLFNAPVEKVWAAWTEPEQIKKWWGPKDFYAPHVEVDFREGGRYLYAMHGPAGTQFDQDMYSGGTYDEIVPMEKIVCIDHFADADGNYISPKTFGMNDLPDEMRVTVTFEDLGDGTTRLTIHHEGAVAGSDDAKNMEQGWNESLDKFALALE